MITITNNTSLEEIQSLKKEGVHCKELRLLGVTRPDLVDLVLLTFKPCKIKFDSCKLPALSKLNLSDYVDYHFEKCLINSLTITNSKSLSKLRLAKCAVGSITVEDSDLYRVNFDSTNYNMLTLKNVKFSSCYFRNFKFPNYNFREDNVCFDDCSFINADLQATTWKTWWANPTGINNNFKKANLTNADFTGCSLTGCSFKEAILNNTNFTSCDLYQANFHNTTLTNCKLNYANLYKTRLWESTLIECELTRASLDWAELNNTRLINTSLKNTYYTASEKSLEHFALTSLELLQLLDYNQNEL